MRVELPSGGWVEYRDRLKGADQTAVQDVFSFLVDPDARQEVGAGIMNRMHDALLARVITAWSFPEPIPGLPTGGEVVQVGDVLDLDDYNALKEATATLMEKVNFSPPPQTFTG